MDLAKLSHALRSRSPLPSCGAVIVAAGSASRMQGIDKILAPLAGTPVIVHTLRAFSQCDAVTEIVVVTRQELIATIESLGSGIPKLRAVVCGGADRQASVENGLRALSPGMQLAAIHDGARPLISAALIEQVIRAAARYGAAAPAVPVKDTVKIVRQGFAERTPDRASLRAVQTPQVFDRDLLQGALVKVRETGAGITDDCSAVEKLGVPVKILDGDERNLKITTPLDLKIAQLLLEEDL